ncbi:DUF2853 family protein [Paracoccus sp. ME4]|uniref:DUF2853 family protein n=1 Tax=Paracoccus sp. ME4 TaxID=3138066 RepID=UPI00398B3D5B
MGKRDDLIAKYAADIRTTLSEEPDMALLEKVTIGCGPSIYDADAETVAASDKGELARIRDNFLRRKLGLPDGPDLDAGIAAVMDRYGRANRSKYRAVVYYLLCRHFRREDAYS